MSLQPKVRNQKRYLHNQAEVPRDTRAGMPDDVKTVSKMHNNLVNPRMHGGGSLTPSNFAASGNPLTVKNIKKFHANFSYLSI